jgi:hypothetical protein
VTKVRFLFSVCSRRNAGGQAINQISCFTFFRHLCFSPLSVVQVDLKVRREWTLRLSRSPWLFAVRSIHDGAIGRLFSFLAGFSSF